ncbi:hypothetical protein P280DRAFT_18566 [Massarina eburnea CBS 473.64]|uniref:DUF1996 domain-containing protein n=1 Tax=Massarina eburnea CBS 473.64 TaxID=1395130 RepID=A0A6A6SHD5_9PLEO|nr:hypothetical protein P280DRAFT_18566 [Massarina eburnea CBS 473.64]
MKTVILSAVLAGGVDAFWRMECHSRTGYSRLDPIINAGEISSHAHAFHGGNNINMNTKYADLRDSDCTSCLATDDKSAYWTPGLMFQYTNGTTEIVPQIGGMLAYYLLFSNAGETIETFPEGFQMVTGDNRLRNFTGTVPDPEKSLWTAADKTQLALGQKAIGMNCLDYSKTPEPSMYRHFLPDKAYLDANCANGIRAEIFFPSCWNGKDLDSDDHKSHVAYPDLVNGGDCPKGFEHRIPSLFFETIWNTNAFKGVDGTFVFANGDPTGYGYHADFMNGWSTDILSQAIKTCTNASGNLKDCPVFNLQTEAEADKCKYEEPLELLSDLCLGPADGLCGNIEISYGPAYAPMLTPGKTESPTSKPTSTRSSTTAVVPTLSHTSATKTGGAITVLNAAQASLQAEVSNAAPASSAEPSADIKKADVSSKVSSKAAVTSAPVASSADNGSIISTSTFTSKGVVYHVAIEEIAVTVTATPTAAPKAKRHEHHVRQHLHRMH